jgi:hypothetical protein
MLGCLLLLLPCFALVDFALVVILLVLAVVLLLLL